MSAFALSPKVLVAGLLAFVFSASFTVQAQRAGLEGRVELPAAIDRAPLPARVSPAIGRTGAMEPVSPMVFERPAAHKRVPLVDDWSTRHWIYPGASALFSSPQQIVDPRLLQSWLKGHPEVLQARSEALERIQLGGDFLWRRFFAPSARVDWAMSLGPTAGMPIGEYPAKYAFDITRPPDCTNDFAVFVINAIPAVGGQANIVAFNNLYSGPGPSLCNMSAPTFLWSYAAGSGAISTSPLISNDGTKVAFIDNDVQAHFRILTWASNQGTDATHAAAPAGASSVTDLTFTSMTNPNCAASESTATNASPFIDYANDVAYLGTDDGVLYKINGVFNSTPTLAYCITVNANRALTSPVYDIVSGNVYVSDGQLLYGYTPGATGFTSLGTPAALGSLTAHSINDAPMVDGANGFVYTLAGANVAGTNAQLAQTTLNLGTTTVATIGDATTASYVLNGAVDNKYFVSGPTPAATFYACGTQIGSGGNKPSLYGFTFGAGGLLNTTAVLNDFRGIAVPNTPGTCSPLMEIDNGTTDRLFVGVSGNDDNSNRVTTWGIGARLTGSSLAAATATGQTGGTSAFIIDNLSTAAEAASIYFGTLARGTTQCGSGNYCAVKLTQSALQ